MEEKVYSVYVHINNNDNNKAYVGMSKNAKRRWGNGKGYKGQEKFYNAIKKYGWDNFKHIILFKNLTLKEAWEKEKEYIKKYDSIYDGYNVHEGGEIKITPAMTRKGYVTKRLKKSGLFITSLINRKAIRYNSVEEASLRTGISEYWFYQYYRREVNCLDNYLIRFDIDSNTSEKVDKVLNK